MTDSATLPLLTTKLFMPAARENRVERLRLHHYFDDCLNCRLVLVTAPAGSGKTTLVTSWLARQGKPVAWVSLDKNDNNPLIFLSYVAAALHQVEAGVCETIRPLLTSPDPPPLSVLLTYFINDLACLSKPTILVLDDYHLIESTRVDEIVDFLIENKPPQLQIIITSRTMPNFSISRWRARNDIVEVALDDLRFSYAEAKLFLQDIMVLPLTDDEVSLLHDQTEGWITGLQLAALSLRSSQRSGGDFIHEMSGDDRLIGDYLVDEVIEQQPLEVRQFLVRTSILQRFSASLCNGLLGIENAQNLLLYLENANLFLVALDNRRGWYRYHHLFGEMLRTRLDQKRPEMVATLYQRAIQWHLDNDLINDAIQYSIEAEDYEKTAVLIEEHFDQFQVGSQRARIIQWAEMIPEENLKQHDVLWSQYIMVLFFYADFNTALETLRRFWHDSPIDEDKFRMVQAIENPLMAAITLHTTLDAQRVRDLNQKALDILPQKNVLMRGIALGHYGSASLYLGDLDAATEYLGKAIQLIETIYARSVITVFRNYQAETEAVRGNLNKASVMFRQIQDYINEYGLHEGHNYADTLLLLGLIHYEWNELEEAEKLIREGQRLAEIGGSIEGLLLACQATAKLFLAKGEFPDIKERLNNVELHAAKFLYPPIVMDRIGGLRSLLALSEGDTLKAENWAQAFVSKQGPKVSCLQKNEWLAVARINLVTGKIEECIRILKALQDEAAEQDRLRDWIWVTVLLARTRHQLGEQELALSSLNQVLVIAEPEGYVRTFVDAGVPMAEMLMKLLSDNGRFPTPKPSAIYIQRILDGFPVATEKKRPSVPKLLTPRELEILQLLADGNSYAQISQQLFITENTLKTHIKRIYGKLDVHNRMNAVLVAQEINLL